jgi:aconitate hydratase
MSYTKELSSNGKQYKFYSLKEAEKKFGGNLSKLPFGIKILLENLLRNENGVDVKEADIKACFDFTNHKGQKEIEIGYKPARVLMQDFTGVPAVVDLAAMRDAVKKMGGNPLKINPIAPTHLVIDHSVQVDYYGESNSMQKNTALEMERNKERYNFLKWGQESFDNFKVVPPGTGICHQVNLEHIAKVVWEKDGFIFPDTCVGTDSHTTMVNGLSVLGWGVGGIEAESVMLGQFISLLIPEVIGFKLKGKLKEGVTATDLVLTVTEMLRKKKVVGKFVEFYGEGVSELSLADRATIANMAPEYGATCGLFAPDDETLNYLHLTGRSEEQIALVKAYMKEQGMWFNPSSEPVFTDTLELDLGSVKPSLAGPKRPQDRVLLEDIPASYENYMTGLETSAPSEVPSSQLSKGSVKSNDLTDGSVVIAAITSCTNTSNPKVLISAGLVAKKAVELGLKVKPFVKTSLAPGSRVVEEYLKKSGLQTYLDKLGFNIVGFGCTTCIGNSGPLKPEFEKEIVEEKLSVASVLSGNRNFEGRVHPLVKMNYLASPPLVVAFAIAGTLAVDLTKEPIGYVGEKAIYLKDIWPTNAEVEKAMNESVTREMFVSKYSSVYDGDDAWKSFKTTKSETYNWEKASSYIENPPYFEGMKMEFDGKLNNVKEARTLLVLGDSITTDHISPAGDISKKSPASTYLREMGVADKDFNSYGARRGSHSVMMRGTFANIRIKNEMLGGVEGPLSKVVGSHEVKSVYDVAMEYKKTSTPLVIFAGKEYGTGSSRDWAAKGTFLLGVKAVIAESFERIHRSNLIGMGVLPLEFTGGETRVSLGIKGDEKISITGVETLGVRSSLKLKIERANGEVKETTLLARVDTATELDYLKNGGIMQFVMRDLLKK